MTVWGAAVAGTLAVGLGVVGAVLVLASAGGQPSVDPAQDRAAVAAASAFLDRYVAADGRVVRHDQGGDTVSEGQAYALLAAMGIRAERRFRRIWRWTRTHLQRPDALLAWRWSDGRVVDDEPASDADLDAARALVLAGRRFSDRGLVSAGVRIGQAVLEREVMRAEHGRPVLVAGPWAREQGVVSLGYAAPRTYAVLERVTGDGKWGSLARGDRTTASDLISIAPGLPPDWAKVGPDGHAVPIARPGDRASPRFGLDAQRLPVRFAESCSRIDRKLAAALWPLLRERAESDAMAQSWDLRGRPSSTPPHPLTWVSAAAAASAAGDHAARDALLDRAQAAQRRSPSYYGEAWVALGRLMLQTNRLAGCGLADD
jgi:endoglucanase